MSVVLPKRLPVMTGWSLADYRDAAADAAADAAGIALAEFAPLGDGEIWIVDHAVVACTSALPTQIRLYANRVSDRTLLDGSASGNFDVADWPAGLRLAPSTTLLARWTGATPGAIATLTLQVRILLRSG